MSARFPQRARIHVGEDFRLILKQPEFRLARSSLVLCARANRGQCARLGVVAGKKQVALAVQRHRIKRLARESFRARADALRGVDAVVLVRGKIKTQSNKKIFRDLDFLWRQLQQKNDSKNADVDARASAVSD